MEEIRAFDAHCDALYRGWCTGEGLDKNKGHFSLDKLMAFTSYAQFFACFVKPEDTMGQSLWEVFLAQAAQFHRETEKNRERLAFCTTAEDVTRAWAEGRTAGFLSVEGGELLECDPGRLEEAFRLGVRAVNLTWNHPNLLSGANEEESDRGLSPAGADFVRAMGRLGMLVDVSHLSDAGFWDVIRLARGPILASHSNSRRVYFHPRNLTDEQFTAIIDLQGAVGLNLCPKFLGDDPGLDDAVRHLEHFLALGGEDVVALGGDWDGVDALPRGVRDVTGWAELYRRLRARGYGQELLDKLFYKNMMRVVSKVCIM